MGLTGPSPRNLSLRVPSLLSAWGLTIRAAGAESPDPGHNFVHAPNTPCSPRSLRLCAPRPRGPEGRLPPRAVHSERLGSKRLPAPPGASLAPRPHSRPSPYLLPPRPLPPSLAFDSPARPGSGSPQTRPRPAPARPRAASSLQIRPRPLVNTPPFTPPRAARSSGRGSAGGPRGTLKKANSWVLPGSGPRSPQHSPPTPATGRLWAWGIP